MSVRDYAANFDDFLGEVKDGQPFCFWLGTHELHRRFEQGIGAQSGKDPAKVNVPPIIARNSLFQRRFPSLFGAGEGGGATLLWRLLIVIKRPRPPSSFIDD